METCKNCGNSFEDGFSYCPHCGQSTDEKLSFKVLFHSTINNYFSVDARFFRSFVPLMVKPGFLPKSFVGGKRLTYLHPAQTYLFVSVIFFFVFSFVSREQQRQMDSMLESGFDDQEQVSENDEQASVEKEVDTTAQIGVFTIKRTANDSLDSQTYEESGETDVEFDFLGTHIEMDTETIDSLIAAKVPEEEIYKEMGMPDNASAFEHKVYEQTLKVYDHKGSGVLQAFYDTIPITMFFLLPVFALILKLLYYRKGPFSHHLVFSFYLFSFLFLTFTVLMGANLFWDIPDWIDSLALFSTFLYLVLGTRNFYGQGFILSFIKSGLATFLFFVFVIPFTIVFMFLAAFMFY